MVIQIQEEGTKKKKIKHRRIVVKRFLILNMLSLPMFCCPLEGGREGNSFVGAFIKI